MTATVNDQSITITDESLTVSESVGIYECDFTFDASWDTWNKTAVFEGAGETIEMIIVDNKAQIPWEVLKEAGWIKIGVYGTKGGEIKPTIWSDQIYVAAGTVPGSVEVTPTPSIYAQILDLANDAKDIAEDAQDTADDVASDWASVSATATTLSAGLPATVTFADNTFAFGIPKGAKGDTGATGATGATPDFSIGTVSTLETGQSATATITGTAAAPVLNLGLPKGNKGDNGDVANIADAYSTSATYAVGDYCTKDGVLKRSNTAITTAEAWNSAHWDDAKLGGDVSTLRSALGATFPLTMTSGYYINNANGGRQSNNAYACTDYVEVKPLQKIKLSHVTVFSSQGVSFYNANKGFISAYSGSTGGDITINVTVPNNAYYFRATALYNNIIDMAVENIFSDYVTPIIGWEKTVNPIINNNSRKTSSLKQSAVNEIKSILTFVVGSIGSGGQIGTAKYRIVTPNLVTAEEAMTVTSLSGYRFGVITYSNGIYTDSGWKTSYDIEKGTQFLLQVGKTPEDTSLIIADPYDNDIYRNISIVATAKNADDFWKSKFNNPKALSIKKITTSNVYSQGACTVANNILGFKGSANDHSSTNDIYIYNPENNMALVGTMTHNLGHCATADYNTETDVLLTGNGDANTSITPVVWFVKNAKSKVANGGSIMISDTDVYSIDFTGIDGYGCGACFGESSDFIYLFTADDPTNPNTNKERYVYKVMLGKGNNDYSSDGYGTYISGVDTTDYNGTAKIIKQFTFNLPGEIQGLKYINGVLILSTDSSIVNNVLTGYVALLCITQNDIYIKDLYEIPTYSNGARIRTEAEGITFYKTMGYMSIVNSGVGTIVAFPVAML